MATFNYKMLATETAKALAQAAGGGPALKQPADITTGILTAAVLEDPTALLHQVIRLLTLERERAERAEAEAGRCQHELHLATKALQEAEDREAVNQMLSEVSAELTQHQHREQVAELEQRIEGLVDGGRCAEVENDLLREHAKELEREMDEMEAELLDVRGKLRAAQRHYHTSPEGTVKLREALAREQAEHAATKAELTLLQGILRLAQPPAAAASYDSDNELSDVD